MLVLSRKKNESIVLNKDITVVVVDIRGDKVRLGVEAPKDVPVHRREVYDAIRRNDPSYDAGVTDVKHDNSYRQFQEQIQLGDYIKASQIYEDFFETIHKYAQPNELRLLNKNLRGLAAKLD